MRPSVHKQFGLTKDRINQPLSQPIVTGYEVELRKGRFRWMRIHAFASGLVQRQIPHLEWKETR